MKHITPEDVGLSSARLERIRSVMQRYVDQQLYAVGLMLIARRGQIAHNECFGMMDIGTAPKRSQRTLGKLKNDHVLI